MGAPGQAATGDIPVARADQDRKVSYEAARLAGRYAYQLQANPNYWQQCGTVTGAPWVRNEWNKVGGDPRQVAHPAGRPRPSSRSRCSTRSTRRPRSTRPARPATPAGRRCRACTLRNASGATGRSNGDYRSVVGTFKRRGFMDFIYFTQWEKRGPLVSGATGCDKPRSQRGSGCVNIQFAAGDLINGPFHTNDESILTRDSPTFGRASKSDNFEVAGASPGYTRLCGSGSPTFNGPRIVPASTLQMPDSNDKLATWPPRLVDLHRADLPDVPQRQHGRRAVGPELAAELAERRRAHLHEGQPPAGRPGRPPNGVIFIENGASCSGTYQKYQHGTNTAGCGDVAISGMYTQSLTIGARNDIIVNANLVHGNDAMMAIAENFVRVYHPMTGTGTTCGSNLTGVTPVYQIDAAILALNHSFMVDNYHCGAPLTDTPSDPAKAHHLNVNGAIAQYYRGTVATQQRQRRGHGLPEELQLRRSPEVPLAAELPGPRPDLVADRPPDRAAAGDQAVAGAAAGRLGAR